MSYCVTETEIKFKAMQQSLMFQNVELVAAEGQRGRIDANLPCHNCALPSSWQRRAGISSYPTYKPTASRSGHDRRRTLVRLAGINSPRPYLQNL